MNSTKPTRPTVMQLARRAVAYEWGMWRSLYRWITRRPRAPHPDAAVFGYSGANAPLLWVFIVLNAFEIPALHLLVPWPAVRLIVDVLGAYGLFWMFGLLASLRVHPHVIDGTGLRVRNGVSVDIAVGWDAVATVRTRRRSLDRGRTVQFEHTTAGRVVSVAVLSQTNVDVVLRRPTTLTLPKGGVEPVVELRFYVDDPDAFVARAREHLPVDRTT